MSNYKEIFLDFPREIDDTGWFYEDNRNTFRLVREKKKSFFDDLIDYSDQCLEFILTRSWWEEEAFRWDPEYLLLGHFFEGLLRVILMRELTAEEFFTDCFYPVKSNDRRYEDLTEEEKKRYGRFKPLGKLKTRFLELEKITSLPKDQSERVKHVLEYVLLQRNKHVHNHPKGMDTYSVRYDIYLLIKVLAKIFGIKFSKETANMLEQKIKLLLKNFSSTRYEPVWEEQSNSSIRRKE